MPERQHETVTVPLHSLRNVLRFVRPAAEADALTDTELSAFLRLAAIAGLPHDVQPRDGNGNHAN